MILLGVPTPMFILNFLQESIASCSLICFAKSFATLTPLSSNFRKGLPIHETSVQSAESGRRT